MDTILAGRYQLHESIGTGGMAEVFLATDQRLGRQVAVKVLNRAHAAQEAFVERFKREAQAAASLDHPNIVPVYDWGPADDSYYIVMAYISGRTLRDIQRERGSMSESEALPILASVASALAHAHDQGIVHRDIKPHNILIDQTGEPRVTDFGIAQATGLSSLTETSVVLGTAHYLSPEQATRQPLDARTDIYSLGIVAYELLTGQLPFQGDTIVELAMQHVHNTPPPLRQHREEISPTAEQIVMRCIEKSPDGRYPNAHELQSALSEAVLNLDAPQQTAATVAMAAAPPVERPPGASETAAMPHRRPAPPRRPPPEPSARRRTGFSWAAPLIVGLVIVGLVVLLITQLGGAPADDASPGDENGEVVAPDPTTPPEQEEIVPEAEPEDAPAEQEEPLPEQEQGDAPAEQEQPAEPEPTPEPENQDETLENQEDQTEPEDAEVQGFQSVSGNVACDGEYQGGVAESIVVPGNAICVLAGVQVNDDIQMNPGSVLRASDIEIYGNVQAQGAAELDLGGTSFVDGNIEFERGGAARVAGTTVTGNIQFDENSGHLVVDGNRVDGNVEVEENRGGVTISGNVINGNLECEGNDPPPGGGGNTVSGDLEGQCSGL